ncbi:MAG: HAMP domain-containing protein [Spirochaetia bacterium]|nr:HAMP domain-containing protein [Spirochaetia bacterium]
MSNSALTNSPELEAEITAEYNGGENLSAKERKRLQKLKQDKEYKDNEIKWGLRFKLLFLFSAISLGIAIGIMIPAITNQTNSLLAEKKKQGKVMIRGLTSAIKNRLLDLYALNDKKLKKINSYEQYKNFYQNNGISELIFEDVDQVLAQPDVEYAYVLGKHDIALGHTNPKIEAYTKYKFEKGINNYFTEFKAKQNLDPVYYKTPRVLDKTIQVTKSVKIDKEKSKDKVIDVMDFSYIMTFKSNPELKDAIGEVHIGISLESVHQQIFDNKVELQMVGAIAIAFGILAAIIFAAFLSRPIRKIIFGMQQVTKGNFHESVILHSKDEVGLLSRTFNVMLKGMSILVSPEVAQVVLSGGDLTKSGEKREVTVLFSDIRSFTTISESLTPHEVVDMLNQYMEIMTDIIIKYGGVVDKFVGDEIFAVFGAPFDHPMHPLCATATAIEMDIELDKHNENRRKEGKPPIMIGIGVNTGDVIAGAMGSSKRVDYTSIGDAVNLGARLEGTNKVYGTRAIISEFTYDFVKNDIITRELDLIRVKGKNKPVTIYEAVDLTETGRQKIQKFLSELKSQKHH